MLYLRRRPCPSTSLTAKAADSDLAVSEDPGNCGRWCNLSWCIYVGILWYVTILWIGSGWFDMVTRQESNRLQKGPNNWVFVWLSIGARLSNKLYKQELSGSSSSSPFHPVSLQQFKFYSLMSRKWVSVRPVAPKFRERGTILNICLEVTANLVGKFNCRASRTGDALRVGGIRGCQAEEFVLAAQVWTGLVQ